MPPRTKGRSTRGSGDRARRDAAAASAIDLADLATALTDAVIGAKRVLDATTIDVASQYQAHRVLRHLPPPSFAIGEVRFVIKFAITQMPSATSGAARSRRRQMHVVVDTASLSEIAPHLISEVELRIAPEAAHAQSAEAESDAPEE
jgi:hypothetical protein